MTKYLLDTSVLSALAPGRGPSFDDVRAWILDLGHSVLIPVVAVGEVEAGIAKLRRIGAVERSRQLSDWLGHTVQNFDTRIIPYDVAIAERVGFLSDYALSIGRHPGLADIVIAATAGVHDMTVLTRNTRHFEPLGVPVLDPFVP